MATEPPLGVGGQEPDHHHNTSQGRPTQHPHGRTQLGVAVTMLVYDNP